MIYRTTQTTETTQNFQSSSSTFNTMKFDEQQSTNEIAQALLRISQTTPTNQVITQGNQERIRVTTNQPKDLESTDFTDKTEVEIVDAIVVSNADIEQVPTSTSQKVNKTVVPKLQLSLSETMENLELINCLHENKQQEWTDYSGFLTQPFRPGYKEFKQKYINFLINHGKINEAEKQKLILINHHINFLNRQTTIMQKEAFPPYYINAKIRHFNFLISIGELEKAYVQWQLLINEANSFLKTEINDQNLRDYLPFYKSILEKYINFLNSIGKKEEAEEQRKLLVDRLFNYES